jgi:UDP-2,3-diacylglucosamine hydrolase
MSEEYLFISDCHLDPRRPEVSTALIQFLQARAAAARRLYILGDLFEVWLGDDDPADGLQQVIDALYDLAATCEIFFIAGNRDFLLGEDFAARVGMTLLEEPHKLQLEQSRVVLLHGDTLCTDDHDYQKFRALVRDPAWISSMLAKSLAERQQLAARLRDDSKTATHQKTSEIMDVNETTVADCFRANDADVIIHGHTHRPALHRYDAKLRRIVLGDWVREPSFLSWQPGQDFRLCDPRVR